MEPIQHRRGSTESRHSGAGSPQTIRSDSRASSGTRNVDSASKNPKETKPSELEKEVTFKDDMSELEPVGYELPHSDSSTDEEPEPPRVQSAGPELVPVDLDDQDLEPHLDEDAVKEELGGDPELSGQDSKNKTKMKAHDSKETKMTDEEEDVIAEVSKGKKRGRKLKKRTEKRTAFDGREVFFVTEFTQTDWNWKDTTERTGKGILITPTTECEGRSVSSLKSILVKPESRENASRSRTEEGSTQDDRTVTDLTPFSLQPNDEFGIPMLDISSDSDSSDDDDDPRKVKTHKHHLPSIGPPQILKYIRESTHLENQTDKTSSDMDDELSQMESADFVLDEYGNVAGAFSGPCEFCGLEIKPFPTLEQQLSLPPESLYCCEDYREFVEFAMTTANRLEEDAAKKDEKISIKVHRHHGSKQARKMAKEQAVQRMRERELQKRQQEATGMQQSSYQFSGAASQGGGGGIGGGGPRGPKSNQPGGPMMFKDMAVDQEDGEDRTHKKGNLKKKGGEKKGKSRGVIGWDGSDGGERDLGGEEEEEEEMSEEFVVEERVEKLAPAAFRGGEKWLGMDRSDLSHRGGGKGTSSTGDSVGHATRLAANQGLATASYSSYTGLGSEARQMKTINYQLSSQKCLEEGWTLKAPSPLTDDKDCELFVPEPLHPAIIASGRVGERRLIEKFYPDGSKFLTMFPDGTGNVFYPSGRAAILIISLTLGQYTYIVQDNANEPEMLAIFEPNGYGCCYFANGKIRLNYDQIGGIELDQTGGRKKNWSWRDQETHVHAPPFQPIVFGMNRYIGVRFMAQESIALTLTGKKRSCRFNVGSKLKLISPQNITSRDVDENQLFIDERRIKVDHILNKVNNLLKFPKSPKLDRILPPLSLSVRQHKIDKMKESPIIPSASYGGRRKVVKQSRLSPIPFVSVN